MKKEELQSYYEALLQKLESGESEFVLNSDRAHNAIIERFMLDTSSEIKMYCGEMSVFREGFYAHIDKATGNTADNIGETIGEILRRELSESLCQFIDKDNSSIDIFFERYDTSMMMDLIAPSLFIKGIRLGKIRLYKLKDNLFLKNGVVHTSWTDNNIIRIERNPITHEAICAINAPQNIVDSVKNAFDSMLEVGEIVRPFS